MRLSDAWLSHNPTPLVALAAVRHLAITSIVVNIFRLKETRGSFIEGWLISDARLGHWVSHLSKSSLAQTNEISLQLCAISTRGMLFFPALLPQLYHRLRPSECVCSIFTIIHTLMGGSMRTNIVIDNGLMQRAMKATGLPTKKAVVEEGLRLLIKVKGQEGIRRLRGKIEWKGNLGAMREGRIKAAS